MMMPIVAPSPPPELCTGGVGGVACPEPVEGVCCGGINYYWGLVFKELSVFWSDCLAVLIASSAALTAARTFGISPFGVVLASAAESAVPTAATLSCAALISVRAPANSAVEVAVSLPWLWASVMRASMRSAMAVSRSIALVKASTILPTLRCTAEPNFSFAFCFASSTRVLTPSLFASILFFISPRKSFISARVVLAMSRMIFLTGGGINGRRGFASCASAKAGASKRPRARAVLMRIFIPPFYTPFLFCKQFLFRADGRRGDGGGGVFALYRVDRLAADRLYVDAPAGQLGRKAHVLPAAAYCKALLVLGHFDGRFVLGLVELDAQNARRRERFFYKALWVFGPLNKVDLLTAELGGDGRDAHAALADQRADRAYVRLGRGDRHFGAGARLARY